MIHRKGKLGLGSAYKEGFMMALEKFEPDLIVEMDADHSHDPKEISSMMQKIQDYDFVLASRHVKDSVIIGWDTYRKLLHLTAGFLAGKFGGIEISDPTSGFRIFKKTLRALLIFLR